MTTKEDIDTQLARYLERQETDARQGYTIENVMLAQNELMRLYRGLKADVVTMSLRQDKHGQDIRGIKKILRDNNLENTSHPSFDDIDTGQFQIAALQHALKEQQDARKEDERKRDSEIIWWKRSAVSWVVGGIGALIIATISGAAAYILGTFQSRGTPQGK